MSTIIKASNMVWNGTAWVEVQSPTSSDLVTHGAGTVESVLNALGVDVAAHTGNAGIHISAADREYLDKLADGDFATIEQLINVNNIIVVDDINARDALTNLVSGTQVWVRDATDDPAIDVTGTVVYIWNDTDEEFVFVYQFGSAVDLTMSWSGITGRPASTPAQIDEAVETIALARLGNVTTISATAPTNPQVGDTWYQIVS